MEKQVVYWCQHCGRKWQANTKSGPGSRGWTGFLASTVNGHKFGCARRTPAQRRARAQADEKRWAKKPNKHTTVTDAINYQHPGMLG